MKPRLSKTTMIVVLAFMAVLTRPLLLASAAGFAFEWFRGCIEGRGFSYGPSSKIHLFVEERPLGMIITLYGSDDSPASIHQASILAVAGATDREEFLQATWDVYMAFRLGHGDASLFQGTSKQEILNAIMADMDNMDKRIDHLVETARKDDDRESRIVVHGISFAFRIVKRETIEAYMMILTPREKTRREQPGNFEALMRDRGFACAAGLGADGFTCHEKADVPFLCRIAKDAAVKAS